jgi:hypothetical protein
MHDEASNACFFVHCFNLLYGRENMQIFHLKMASEDVCVTVRAAFILS